MTALAWLIPLLPFLAFWLIVFFGRRLPGQGASVAIGALLAAAVFSLLLFFRLLGGAEPIHSTINWLVLGQQPLALGIQVDALTAVMLLVVTVVGSMIFIYSVGYMHGDPRYPRFFAYLSLFAASMLLLVLADNFLFLYVGWELVGLCSYLLIGFWFERPAAARASLKAFITTRVGDVFFFAGILLVFFNLGTLGFGQTFEAVESGHLSGGLLTGIALLLFGGAIGKSAQVPLHVWLPDAMEGPTPVSALIHAATMVAAGVYMVARLFLIFFSSPHHTALAAVAWIGGVRERGKKQTLNPPSSPLSPSPPLFPPPWCPPASTGWPASSSSSSPRPTTRPSRWSPGSAGSAPSWRRRSPWCRTTSSA